MTEKAGVRRDERRRRRFAATVASALTNWRRRVSCIPPRRPCRVGFERAHMCDADSRPEQTGARGGARRRWPMRASRPHDIDAAHLGQRPDRRSTCLRAMPASPLSPSDVLAGIPVRLGVAPAHARSAQRRRHGASAQQGCSTMFSALRVARPPAHRRTGALSARPVRRRRRAAGRRASRDSLQRHQRRRVRRGRLAGLSGRCAGSGIGRSPAATTGTRPRADRRSSPAYFPTAKAVIEQLLASTVSTPIEVDVVVPDRGEPRELGDPAAV